MYELLDRVHLLFTGERASELLDLRIEEGTPGTGDLDGVTVYAGMDRLPAQMPKDKYPYLVLEPGTSDQSYATQGVSIETIDMSFAVLVEGKHGTLFGRNDTGQKGISEYHDIIKNIILGDKKLTINGSLSPYTCRVERISAGSFIKSDERGVLYSRGCDMSIEYRRADWTGQ